MIVNTHRLFVRLLPRLQISSVCDIGSMDGADALIFRDAAPTSSVYAFEANPENYRLMEANRALQQHNIQPVPLAVTDYDGTAEFFLVAAHCGRGLSSLHQRSSEWASPAGVVEVKTTRLDTFLADKSRPDDRLALWIDAEGKAYEVLRGTTGVAKQVHLLHVEVETSACIGVDQKFYSDVKALLQQLGFAEFATDQAHSDIQFNALFLRSDLSAKLWFQTRMWLLCARLRYMIVQAVRKVCPACLRRYRAKRSVNTD